MIGRDDEPLILGEISGAHGVRGWVKVYSHTRPIADILGYSPWYLRRRVGWVERKVLAGRPQGKGMVVQLKGCNDRDQAAALRGVAIGVRPQQLARLDEDEYYWRDLIGLEVVTRDGQLLGHIDHLMETGNNDVLVLRGERERLLPYLPGTVILETDLKAGRMVVDWDPEF